MAKERFLHTLVLPGSSTMPWSFSVHPQELRHTDNGEFVKLRLVSFGADRGFTLTRIPIKRKA